MIRASATRRPMVAQWYRDPVSCLQSTLATVLIHAGADPLETLGLRWEFRYLPGDVRPEEFYWPCSRSGDLAGSVAPHHPVSSRWHPIPDEDPLGPLEAALDAGRLPIVAVDNYYLPFRPAFGDVHAAHLVVVCDIDRDADTVSVSDAMPPAFQGTLPTADLLRSARSQTPVDDQDAFFSGAATCGRWLEVSVAGFADPLTPDRLRRALETNLLDFGASRTPLESEDAWIGLPGMARFTEALRSGALASGADDTAGIYTFGWAAQAQAALHGELLRRTGTRWNRPALAEAGRRVEQVAHGWTGLRVTAAHRRAAPSTPTDRLADHAERLQRTYEVAVAAIRQAVGTL